MKRGRPASVTSPELPDLRPRGSRSSSRLVNKPQSEQSQAVAAYMNEKTKKLQNKRREALQEDNFFGVAAVEKDDDDDDNFVPNEDGELVLAPSSKKKKSSSTKKKKNLKPVLAPKSFKSLMEVGEAVDYEAAAFPDSVLPVRKFCCVCGLLAPYRCPRCSQCFCCIKCDETHKEMRCLKFTR